MTTAALTRACELADMIAERFAGDDHPHVRAALFLLEHGEPLAAQAALVTILRPPAK